MENDSPIGIIELDDKNIKCIIFKIKNDTFEILSSSISQSEGIQNDTIINLKKATNAIRSCISSTEKKADVTLKKISVLFEQPEFLCTKFSKNKKINGSKIDKDDIDFLLKEAKKELVYNDRNQSIIHIFNYNYIVDGKNFIEEPINVYADKFSHEITFISTKKNYLKNIRQTLNDCDIEVERFISRTFVLGIQLLKQSELQSGAVIIDFGYEKTSLGLFSNLALIHSMTFPVGYNHIIKDISKVCSLNLEESKNIISEIDFTFEDNQKMFDENNNLKKNYFVDSNYRKISKNLILDVIKFRLDEILDILKKQLSFSGFDSKPGINLAIHQNCNFIDVENYFADFFQFNIKKNKNMEDVKKNFIACLGAVELTKNGRETEAIPQIDDKTEEKMGFFSKLFRFNKKN